MDDLVAKEIMDLIIENRNLLGRLEKKIFDDSIETEPLTYGAYIRSMDNKALARFLTSVDACVEINGCNVAKSCPQCWLDRLEESWLKI